MQQPRAVRKAQRRIRKCQPGEGANEYVRRVQRELGALRQMIGIKSLRIP